MHLVDDATKDGSVEALVTGRNDDITSITQKTGQLIHSLGRHDDVDLLALREFQLLLDHGETASVGGDHGAAQTGHCRMPCV